MIVDEKDELTERRELIRKRLCQLGKTPFEAAPPVQSGGEPLGEVRRVTAQGADEIGEEDEWILVAAAKREPGSSPPRSAQEVGVLRQKRRLPVAGRGVDEGQPVTLGAFQTIE